MQGGLDLEVGKERVNTNISELSKKLLDGWTLLSDGCPLPDCNVPLVQYKGEAIECIECKHTFRKGAEGRYVAIGADGQPLSDLPTHAAPPPTPPAAPIFEPTDKWAAPGALSSSSPSAAAGEPYSKDGKE